ncbi:protein MATERNALLY EXPRESSED GENE 1-like [Zea mays]|uniref:Meg domain-containing protein n=1 Tax=Zea mays TaxID=4577 RepID=A0A1D6HUE6_MAIZE|nr:protein MATERNALLY EXPRESSED GENE 1-like [Zea mays]ONM51926.1 hypothetical protein ZEAMMB73_Zm00001d019032 [Zea mays]|eukprot:XP_008652139.1 protein MATERNALLY EXPRESSED GENE 1-like [Zea mays]
MEYRKRVDALVFFSFLLVGYFAAHAYDEKGHVTDEVAVPAPSEGGVMRATGAHCEVSVPCKDKRCYCCVGGRIDECYLTMPFCNYACF